MTVDHCPILWFKINYNNFTASTSHVSIFALWNNSDPFGKLDETWYKKLNEIKTSLHRENATWTIQMAWSSDTANSGCWMRALFEPYADKASMAWPRSSIAFKSSCLAPVNLQRTRHLTFRALLAETHKSWGCALLPSVTFRRYFSDVFRDETFTFLKCILCEILCKEINLNSQQISTSRFIQSVPKYCNLKHIKSFPWETSLKLC